MAEITWNGSQLLCGPAWLGDGRSCVRRRSKEKISVVEQNERLAGNLGIADFDVGTCRYCAPPNPVRVTSTKGMSACWKAILNSDPVQFVDYCHDDPNSPRGESNPASPHLCAPKRQQVSPTKDIVTRAWTIWT